MLLDCLRNRSNCHEKSCRARAPSGCLQIRAIQRALPKFLSWRLRVGPPVLRWWLRGAEDIEGALRELASRRADVVIVVQTSLLLLNCPQIAASALAMRLPTVYGYREHVTAG